MVDLVNKIHKLLLDHKPGHISINLFGDAAYTKQIGTITGRNMMEFYTQVKNLISPETHWQLILTLHQDYKKPSHREKLAKQYITRLRNTKSFTSRPSARLKNLKQAA